MTDSPGDDTAAAAAAAALAINGGAPLRTEPFGPRWVFGEAERDRLAAVMDRAPRAWRSGETVRAFVNAFQKSFGVRGAIATGSGTAAVHAALGALDPDPGAEVITTPATDVGTIVGILQHNCVPVFADWGPDDFNTDPADIERKITEKTAAILVVHLFGFPCDMTAVMAVARRHGLPVIEDCAQAHLAEFGGMKVGSFGKLAAWSFGLKTLSTDQGGMVASPDPALSAAARGFLSKGSVKTGDAWTPYARLGTFSPMTDLQAAVGVAQIARLEEATAIRQMVAAHLDEAFAAVDAVTLPRRRPGDRDVYYMYPYHLDEAAAGCSIGAFVEALRAEGITDAFGPYLKGRGLHRQPMLRHGRTYGRSGFPLRDDAGTLRADYRALRLPRIDALLPGLGFFHMRNSFTERDARDIASAVLKVARGLGLAVRPVAGVAVPPPARRTLIDGSPSPRTSETPTVTTDDPMAEEMPEVAAPVTGTTPTGFGINFRDLGAVAGRGPEAAAANDAAMAKLIEALDGRGGRVFVPGGVYEFSQPITFARLRNAQFVGEGGNSKFPGTVLRLASRRGTTGLSLLSAIQVQFEEIDFVGAGGVSPVIRLGCDTEGGEGLSSLSVSFVGCTIRGDGGGLGILLRDCAMVTFRQCWIKGREPAVQLGEPTSAHAVSRSNGLANTIAFDACHFTGPMVGVRASGVRFSSCLFSRLDDGTGAGLDCSAGRVTNVTFADCFAIEASGGTLFRQGSRGTGLVFENNRVAGYDTALDIDGEGGAVVRANLFQRMAEPVRLSRPEASVVEANTEE